MKTHNPWDTRRKALVGDLVESSKLPGTGRGTIREIRNVGKPQRLVYEVSSFGSTFQLERQDFVRVYYTADDDGSCESVEPKDTARSRCGAKLIDGRCDWCDFESPE
jgi:hypothetical protein